MAQIDLGKGVHSLVDDQDFPFLNQIHWHIQQCRGRRYAASGYAPQRMVLMHRLLVMGLVPWTYGAPEVDHINGDGLDNRRSNLRIVTHQQNMFNKVPYKRRKNTPPGTPSSPFKGVRWGAERDHPRVKPWRAQIVLNGKTIYLGHYRTEEEAAHAYDQRARDLFGPYARLNFPMVAA